MKTETDLREKIQWLLEPDNLQALTDSNTQRYSKSLTDIAIPESVKAEYMTLFAEGIRCGIVATLEVLLQNK